MKRRWTAACAAWMTAAALTLPVQGAGVAVDAQPLSEEHGWIEDGTSYITLRGLSERSGYALEWDGTQAWLSGAGLELSATPGALYVTVNGRALYVEQGVPVTDGKIYLPLRVVAQATGGALRWEAETGTAHLDTTAAVPAASYPEEDLYWLSRVISAESRGEPLLGQIAVGNVVLNRVASPEYPDTIREVVFDTRNGVQFEPTVNGTIYDAPTDSAVTAAKLCLEGADVVGDCLYFFAPALSAGSWIVNNRDYYGTIGCHRFYR